MQIILKKINIELESKRNVIKSPLDIFFNEEIF